MPTFSTRSTTDLTLRAILAVLLAVCPVLWPSGSSPAAVVPLNCPIEENSEEESSVAKTEIEWIAPLRADRRSVSAAGTSPIRIGIPAMSVASRCALTSIPSQSADPYHNGLGTHYRC